MKIISYEIMMKQWKVVFLYIYSINDFNKSFAIDYFTPLRVQSAMQHM